MGIFSIKRTDNNKATISLEDRLDREAASHYLLTVKCFRKDSRPAQLENKPYNRLVSIFYWHSSVESKTSEYFDVSK